MTVLDQSWAHTYMEEQSDSTGEKLHVKQMKLIFWLSSNTPQSPTAWLSPSRNTSEHIISGIRSIHNFLFRLNKF